MRFFFDETVRAAETTFSATPAYIELVTSSADPPGTSFLYLMPGPLPYSVTAAACWGDELDAWLPLLTDAERSGDWVRLLGSTYPTVGRLWEAAAREELGQTALVRAIDPDDMSYKWFARRSVGNVSVPESVTADSVRSLLSAPRLTDAYRRVLNDSFVAAAELATRQPSGADKALMYGKEMYRAQLKTIDTLNEWAPRLTRIFGGG